MPDLPVDVIRSSRRKRTLSARLIEGRLEVRVPADLDPDDEARLVDDLLARTRRKISSAAVDLRRRATELAMRYRLPAPASVEWSSRQMKRWGSCTPDDGRIRISNRLADMPPWVLDSVLVHELAHLEVRGHGPEFRELVDRYELTERATGYLIAVTEGRGNEPIADRATASTQS
jgi:predicted metal-dependent hydrolase